MITRRTRELTDEERQRRDHLYAQWLTRPQYANASQQRLAALLASATSVAMHGPPPTKAQRLGYRTQKRNRARREALRLYGDPTATGPQLPTSPS